MKNPDQAVDNVIKSLGKVQVPAGMESRILQALERRAAAPAPSGWQALRRLATTRAAFTGSIALAGVLCALLWMSKPHRSAYQARLEKMTAAGPVPVKPETALLFLSRRSQPPFTRSKLVKVSALDESDAVALTETRAPSHLASPLPPTEQERLLISVVIRHDPEQVAVLNPEVRAQQELQAKVEFQKFFEPYRPAEESSALTTNTAKGDTK